MDLGAGEKAQGLRAWLFFQRPGFCSQNPTNQLQLSFMGSDPLRTGHTLGTQTYVQATEPYI